VNLVDRPSWGLAALAVSATGIIVMLVVVVRSRDVAAVNGELPPAVQPRVDKARV